ncbi:MAG: DUF1178 family protein [Pseudomonadota bacterium]
MIRYTLKCENDHIFESWFPSVEGYERLRAAGLASCAVCGSTSVEKTLMAPQVRPARDRAVPTPPSEMPTESPAPQSAGPVTPAVQATPEHPSLSTPDTALAKAIERLRTEVEASSDYVGEEFVSEARSMSLGDTPERAIHGEASPEDAKALAEEGVPILPLPFSNRTKSN